jgi:anti-sigma factor RsiW
VNCKEIQENLTAYLHGELTINEVQQLHGHLAACSDCVQEELALRKTQQILSQYHEMALPVDFDTQLTKKINRLQKKPLISITQIISSAAAAILLTLGIQYLMTTTESGALPAHYSLFQKTKETVTEDRSWAERMIDQFMERSAKIVNRE